MSSVQNALNRADKMKLYLEQKYSKMRKEENKVQQAWIQGTGLKNESEASNKGLVSYL